jgi:hypothetical protein
LGPNKFEKLPIAESYRGIPESRESSFVSGTSKPIVTSRNVNKIEEKG